jgi:hypothetical protein
MPESVDGMSQWDFIASLRQAIEPAASEELRAAITAHGDQLANSFIVHDTVRDMIEDYGSGPYHVMVTTGASPAVCRSGREHGPPGPLRAPTSCRQRALTSRTPLQHQYPENFFLHVKNSPYKYKNSSG